MGMRHFITTSILAISLISANAQTNVSISNTAEQILRNNYDPSLYAPSTVISDRVSIVNGIVNDISTDSLKANLITLESFGNRNTGSDTLSNTTGIGAARRWILSRFQAYSAANGNRLVTGYMNFNENICSMSTHKNVYAILPGMDTSRKDVLLVEAHMDSRCEGRCDVSCDAPGMDDNGSGTVLVIELARVMSKYAFDRTIIFTTVTGEEQGLVGGRAWAEYLNSNNIPLLACLNNDVIGGVECGNTSSPPGCSPEGAIDSLNVRIYSYSPSADTARYSAYKQLARYIKLQQEEEINPKLSEPMNINLELREDRVGRGGDHIPFRMEGMLSLRFTSQNEHGDGSGSAPDRQHTTTDVLGVDTDFPPDGIIDEYFVNFNYLRKNTVMNGVNLGLLAQSPRTPSWRIETQSNNSLLVTILGEDTIFKNYRVAVRSMGSGTLYFDTVFEVNNSKTFQLPSLRAQTRHFFSVASVENGIESLFSEEEEVFVTGSGEYLLLVGDINVNAYPNPTHDVVNFQIESKSKSSTSGMIEIYDIRGVKVLDKPIELGKDTENVTLDLNTLQSGNYYYNIVSNHQTLAVGKVILNK